MPGTNLHFADLDHRIGPVKLAAGQFEWLEDAVHVLDARDCVELLDTGRYLQEGDRRVAEIRRLRKRKETRPMALTV